MFKVYAERCAECLFSKDKIVSNARRKELLADCRSRDTHFICHKASIAGDSICCRGFYDTQSTNLIRVAQRLGAVEFVPFPEATMKKDNTMLDDLNSLNPPEGYEELTHAEVNEKVQAGDLYWDSEDGEWYTATRAEIGKYTSSYLGVARRVAAPPVRKRIIRSRRPEAK